MTWVKDGAGKAAIRSGRPEKPSCTLPSCLPKAWETRIEGWVEDDPCDESYSPDARFSYGPAPQEPACPGWSDFHPGVPNYRIQSKEQFLGEVLITRRKKRKLRRNTLRASPGQGRTVVIVRKGDQRVIIAPTATIQGFVEYQTVEQVQVPTKDTADVCEPFSYHATNVKSSCIDCHPCIEYNRPVLVGVSIDAGKRSRHVEVRGSAVIESRAPVELHLHGRDLVLTRVCTWVQKQLPVTRINGLPVQIVRRCRFIPCSLCRGSSEEWDADVHQFVSSENNNTWFEGRPNEAHHLCKPWCGICAMQSADPEGVVENVTALLSPDVGAGHVVSVAVAGHRGQLLEHVPFIPACAQQQSIPHSATQD